MDVDVDVDGGADTESNSSETSRNFLNAKSDMREISCEERNGVGG